MYSYKILEQAIKDFFEKYPETKFVPTEGELIAEGFLKENSI